MTDLDAADDTFGLNRFVRGLAQTELRHLVGDERGIPDRDVIWIEFEDEDEAARLDEATGFQLESGIAAALDQRVPVVMVVSTSGTDIVEGMAALSGWGRVASRLTACSGVIPTIVIVDGPAVSGPALLLGVADFTIMTERSSAFVNGPVMVEEFTGVAIDVDELGGSASHARYTGVATLVVPDRQAAADAAVDLLGYLPDHVDAEPFRWPTTDPGDRPCPEAGARDPRVVDRQLRRSQSGGGDRRRGLGARSS